MTRDKIVPIADSLNLTPDRRGYVLNGERVDGFPDPEQLAVELRAKVARWASRLASDQLTEQQQELLETDERPPAAGYGESEAVAENSDELVRLNQHGFFDSLAKVQAHLVIHPGGEEGVEGASYPLSVGQMAALTGVSERQVRHWSDINLIPTYYVGKERRFYSAALVRAFHLSEAEQYQKTAVATLAKRDNEAGRMLRLIGAELMRTTEPGPFTISAEEVAGAGAALIRYGNALAGIELSGEAPTVTAATKVLPEEKPAAVAAAKKPPRDELAVTGPAKAQHVLPTGFADDLTVEAIIGTKQADAGWTRVVTCANQVRKVAPHKDGGWAIYGAGGRTIKRFKEKRQAIKVAERFFVGQRGGLMVQEALDEVRIKSFDR